MMRIKLLTLLCLLIIGCGDLMVKWFFEFAPAGPGDYHISNVCYFKDFYITGYFQLNGKRSAIIAQYDETGKMGWFKIYKNRGNKFSEGVWVFRATEFSLKDGYAIYQLIRTVDLEENRKLILIKYDSLGSVLWEGEVQESNCEIHSGMLAGNDNLKFLLTGSKEILIAGLGKERSNFFYVRFDSLGRFRDMVECITPEDEIGLCDFKMDKMGNLYLTGITQGINSQFDWITIGYDRYDSLRWVKRYDGITHLNDVPLGILIDDSLNVYIAGTTEKGENLSDLLVIKYNRDGDTLWTKEFGLNKRGKSIQPFSFQADILSPTRHKEISFLYITSLCGNDVILLKCNKEGRLFNPFTYSLKENSFRLTAQDGPLIALECEAEILTKSYLLKFGRFELLGLSRWD